MSCCFFPTNPLRVVAARFGLLLVLAAVVSGCAHLEVVTELPPPAVEPLPLVERATLPLAHCEAAMDDPNYWLQRTRAPDKLLLTPQQIKRLNESNVSRRLINDVFSDKNWDGLRIHEEVDRPEEETHRGNKNACRLPANRSQLGAYTLYTYLKEETERIKCAQRWDADGNTVGAEFFLPLDENLNLGEIRDSNPVAYGITRWRTNVRFYPSEKGLFRKRGDLDFDLLQVSSLQALQPLAIFHTSWDHEWIFAVSPLCRGWIRKSDVVADADPEAIKKFLEPKRPLVVTGHAVEAQWEAGNTTSAIKLYMGTVCPLVEKDDSYYHIALPDMDGNSRLVMHTAFVPITAEVRAGFLPYSLRSLYGEAFQLLHTPYSWGGKGEFRDCSQFLMDVFATMGLKLPRNSASQGCLGTRWIRLSGNETPQRRRAQLKKLALPALLQLPGHIMLYLGQEGEYDYALHDIWAYRQLGTPDEDRMVVVGQVVVSDLSLGEGSRKGTLLQRLAKINVIKP